MRLINKRRPSQKIIAVSGGFDPVHRGHVRMFKEAKKLGDKLVVILNNDNWLKAKKGNIFMPQNERKEILEALEPVDEVIFTSHEKTPRDMSVCRELLKLRPHIFANGGDRQHNNTPEVAICEQLGCRMVFNVGKGGKIQSSSWLLDKHARRINLLEKSATLFQKKAIIFDLDGTLTKSKTPLDTEMACLLKALLEQKKVGVIGGGDYTQFKNQLLRYLHAGSPLLKNLFILPVSGGSFYRHGLRGWQKIYEHALADSEKEKIMKAFAEAFKSTSYVHPKKIYGNTIEDRKSQITFSALGQKAPIKEKYRWNKVADVRPKLLSILERSLSGFEIRFGGLTSIDVTKRGIDKAYGVRQLIKLLRITPKDTAFIGDALHKGGNDYAVKKAKILTVGVKDHEDTKALIRFILSSNR